MPGKREYRTGKYSRLVVFVFLFFTVSSLFSEDFSGRIILEKTAFVVGEEFPLQILVPGTAPLMLSIETPKIPAGLRLLKGPYMRPGKSGTVVDYYFRVEKPGRYVLGSFTLKTAMKTGHTLPVFIKAGKNDSQLNGIADVPPNVKWAVPMKTYYPGEIIPIMFVVENLESPEISLETSIFNNNSGIVSRTSRNGTKEEKTVIKKNIMTGSLYDILYHNHIFIPVFPGSLPLPGAEVFISRNGTSFNTYLPEKKIVITPVPSRIKETNAIGSFESDYTLSNNMLHKDEIIIIKRVIEGTGNFYAVNVPVPYTDKPELVEINLLKENLSAVPDGQWFTGTLTVRFSLKLKKSVRKIPGEALKVTVPDMTVMRIHSEHGDDRRFEFYTLKGGFENIDIKSENRGSDSSAASAEKDHPADGFSLPLFYAVLAAAAAVLVFSIKRGKKSFSALAAVFIIIIILLYFVSIFKENKVYGIISTNSQFNGIYTVPDENSSIKYSAESVPKKLRVQIIGDSQDYYLIIMPDGGDGWIKKDNIRLEDE